MDGDRRRRGGGAKDVDHNLCSCTGHAEVWGRWVSTAGTEPPGADPALAVPGFSARRADVLRLPCLQR